MAPPRVPAAPAHPDEDPVVRAFADAPDDDEPVTPEDAAAIVEAEQDLARGDVISHAELKRRLGL